MSRRLCYIDTYNGQTFHMGLKSLSYSRSVITDTNTILWFGRYQDQTIGLVLQEDPAYLVWANDSVDNFDLHYSLLEIAEQDADRTRWEIMSGYSWRLESQEQLWD
jgi:hypothetical protein